MGLRQLLDLIDLIRNLFTFYLHIIYFQFFGNQLNTNVIYC